jgi:DNA-binding transcriptional LysR family regulator
MASQFRCMNIKEPSLRSGRLLRVRLSSFVSAWRLIHTVAEFIEQHPELVAKDNAMAFLSDDGGKSYNLCHCKCLS